MNRKNPVIKYGLNQGRGQMGRIFAVLLCLVGVASVSARDNSFPLNQVDRPLTLPENMWELSGEAAYLEWESNNKVDWILSLRYGITNDLEFFPLGLRYRILNKPDSEIAIKARLARIGHSSARSSVNGTTKSTIIDSEYGLEIKQRVHPRLAVLYGLEDIYSDYSDKQDRNELRASVQPLFALTEHLALGITGAYRWVREASSTEAKLVKGTVYINVTPYWDIVVEGSRSEFFGSTDFQYPRSNYERAYVIQINWRF